MKFPTTDSVINHLVSYIAKRTGAAPVEIKPFEVWHCYILGNQKWLYGAVVSGDMQSCYYELTYNKEKGQLYIDHYEKVNNTCIE